MGSEFYKTSAINYKINEIMSGENSISLKLTSHFVIK